MKKWTYILFFLCITVHVFGRGPENDQKLLEEVDSLASYMDTDFSAVYTVINSRAGGARELTKTAVFRRDRDKMYTLVVVEPEIHKGQGYLKKGKTLWFYDPESRRFNSTSAQSRFQNSHARNSDFTASTLAQDYRVVSGREEKLGRFDCRVLELESVNDQMTYPYMKIWVSRDRLIRKVEDYSLSRQLLRTTAIPAYQKTGRYFVPEKIVIMDNLKGARVNGTFVHERTLIEISQVSLEDLPESVFSKTFLENVGQ